MRARLVHLDRDAPNGTPLPTTTSFSACGRRTHYKSVTNERVKVICWFCKQTDLFNFDNVTLPMFSVTLGMAITGVVT